MQSKVVFSDLDRTWTKIIYQQQDAHGFQCSLNELKHKKSTRQLAINDSPCFLLFFLFLTTLV